MDCSPSPNTSQVFSHPHGHLSHVLPRAPSCSQGPGHGDGSGVAQSTHMSTCTTDNCSRQPAAGRSVPTAASPRWKGRAQAPQPQSMSSSICGRFARSSPHPLPVSQASWNRRLNELRDREPLSPSGVGGTKPDVAPGLLGEGTMGPGRQTQLPLLPHPACQGSQGWGGSWGAGNNAQPLAL